MNKKEYDDAVSAKKEENKDVLLGVFVIAGAAILGYKLGSRNTERKIAKGINLLWKANPGLREAMWNGLLVAQTKATSPRK